MFGKHLKKPELVQNLNLLSLSRLNFYGAVTHL